MDFALDTNIIIHYLNQNLNVFSNFKHAVAQGSNIIVPEIADYELRRGFWIKPSTKKEIAYQTLTEDCPIVKTPVKMWHCAMRVYAELYRKRFTVGEMDILIAAFCLENKCTLVTNNTADFQNIDALNLVDWSVNPCTN